MALFLVGISPNLPQSKEMFDKFGDQLPDGAIYRLGTTRLHHNGSVYAVCRAPQEDLLASGGEDGVVRLWSFSDGKFQREYRSDSWIFSLVFSPDGKFIAAGHQGEIKIWDLAKGELYRRFELRPGRGGKALVYAMAFSPEGKHLASADTEGDVNIWDMTMDKLSFTLGPRGKNFMHALAFSQDGKRIVAGDGGGNIRIWDFANAKEVKRFKANDQPVLNVMFIEGDARIVSSGADRVIRIWDYESGAQTIKLEGHTGSVTSVRTISNESKLVSASTDGTVRIWDLKNERQESVISTGGRVLSVAVSLDGQIIATGGYFELRLELWSARTGERLCRKEGHTGFVDSLAISPDASCLASSGEDGSIRLWDLTKGNQRFVIKPYLKMVGKTICSLAFSPDGSVLASGSHDGNVRLSRSSDGSELQKFVLGIDAVMSICFSPDGKLLGACSNDRIALFTLPGGEKYREIVTSQKAVEEAVFSPDGTMIACGGQDGTITIWNVSSGRCLRKFSGHQGMVLSVVYSPQGDTLLSAGEDGTVRIWDIFTGTELLRYSGHEGPVFSACFYNSGKCVASAGSDKTVRIWNCVDGNELLTLKGHQEAVSRLASVGPMLASGSSDSTILVWKPKIKSDLKDEDASKLDSEKLWEQLGGKDSVLAYQAGWRLVKDKARTVELVCKKLAEIEFPTPELIDRYLDNLDDDLPQTRSAAESFLEGLDIEDTLRSKLKQSVSLNQRAAIESLLKTLQNPIYRTERSLLWTRTISVLERIGTSEARELVKSMNTRLPWKWVKNEVQQALLRMK